MQNVIPLLKLGFSPTIAKRLNSKLKAMPNGCIEWRGAIRGTFGHGYMSRGSRGAGYEATHRVTWMLEHGPIPEGMQVCHKCDNSPCCNVEHLFLGTQLDNMRDMDAKNRRRAPKGERHGAARLSDAEVAELRHLSTNILNDAELGRMFGVSKQHARSIRLGLKRAA